MNRIFLVLILTNFSFNIYCMEPEYLTEGPMKCLNPELFSFRWNLRSVALSHDGKLAVSGGVLYAPTLQGCLQFWDVNAEPSKIPGPRFYLGPAVKAKYSRLWRGYDITTVDLSPYGKVVAVGAKEMGKSAVIGLWCTAKGKLLRTLQQEDGEIGQNIDSVLYDPTGKLLAGVSFGDVRLWNVETGELVRKFKNASTCADFSSDGRFLAVGGRSVARVHDGRDGQEHEYSVGFAGHEYKTTADDMRDGTHVIEQPFAWTRIFDVESGEVVQESKGSGGNITSLRMGADGITTLNNGGVVRVVGPDESSPNTVKQPQYDKKKHEQPTHLSVDGRLAVAVHALGGMRVLDLASDTKPDARLTHRLTSPQKYIVSVAFSGNGKSVSVGLQGGEVQIWDLHKEQK